VIWNLGLVKRPNYDFWDVGVGTKSMVKKLMTYAFSKYMRLKWARKPPFALNWLIWDYTDQGQIH
jgi:hypothetical protein